ncbi:hypothetical protein CTI12_AA491130 [Artemisia annua]|uniref:Uncharacterized protein n=1 Tax=Artemisia annua TaxID=35608 RepID=A0A2U1LHG9_ARTAN|nr:hypothetical protein CTI12_AA491130 [Artemisia annua]
MSCCSAGCSGGDIAAAGPSSSGRHLLDHVPALFSARALRRVTVTLLDARFSPTTATSLAETKEQQGFKLLRPLWTLRLRLQL